MPYIHTYMQTYIHATYIHTCTSVHEQAVRSAMNPVSPVNFGLLEQAVGQLDVLARCVRLSLCPSVCQRLCLSVCLSVHPSVRLCLCVGVSV